MVQECETDFITEPPGPLLRKKRILPQRLSILDHNFVYWGRVISQLDDPDFADMPTRLRGKPTTGDPRMASKDPRRDPEIEIALSQRACTTIPDPHYQVEWHEVEHTYTAVQKLGRSASVEMCTDVRKDKPNIGPIHAEHP